MVASDSDFGFVVIEPLTPAEVTELFEPRHPPSRSRTSAASCMAASGEPVR